MSTNITNATEIAKSATNNLSTATDQAAQTVQAGVDPLIFAITIFILACFVGYYVVWKVTPALHTPLMAVTNAISGVIIVGAIIALGPKDFGIAQISGFLAVMLAAVNIFGGFIVTQRMLAMFKKK
jgi:H+-translocating NAD(P) transhydrogenase subunit alpha